MLFCAVPCCHVPRIRIERACHHARLATRPRARLATRPQALLATRPQARLAAMGPELTSVSDNMGLVCALEKGTAALR